MMKNLLLQTHIFLAIFCILTSCNKDNSVKGTDGPGQDGLFAVDLGLGVKWASCNLGAGKPEEYGDYYSLGEIETKSIYDYSNYKFGKQGQDSGTLENLSKYNTDPNLGIVDNKTILDLEDDVAHVKLGGNWRIPTKDELAQLVNNCSIERTKINGVWGCKVTSLIKGYTDKWIFIPFSGVRYNATSTFVGSYGVFWTSSLQNETGLTYEAISSGFGSEHPCGYFHRCDGLPVRPVLK